MALGINVNVDVDINVDGNVEVDGNVYANVCGLQLASKINQNTIPSITKIFVMLPYFVPKIFTCTMKSVTLIVLTEIRKLWRQNGLCSTF